MDSVQRRKVRAELASQGYSWDYVDSWQPKIDMWWHTDGVNTEGQIVKRRGVLVPNQPGTPLHQQAKSRIGLLPWPPSEACRCKGCREAGQQVQFDEGVAATSTPPPSTDGQCPHCDKVVRGTPNQKAFRLKSHMKSHKDVMV